MAQWYENRNCVILARNWRCRYGEIDLIVADKKIIVICEVKTRATANFGPPALAVGRQKQLRLRRLGVHWLQEQNFGVVEIRFDVASVVGPRQNPTITVIESAF